MARAIPYTYKHIIIYIYCNTLSNTSYVCNNQFPNQRLTLHGKLHTPRRYLIPIGYIIHQCLVPLTTFVYGLGSPSSLYGFAVLPQACFVYNQLAFSGNVFLSRAMIVQSYLTSMFIFESTKQTRNALPCIPSCSSLCSQVRYGGDLYRISYILYMTLYNMYILYSILCAMYTCVYSISYIIYIYIYKPHVVVVRSYSIRVRGTVASSTYNTVHYIVYTLYYIYTVHMIYIIYNIYI